MLKKIGLFIVVALVSSVFILGAYVKLYPIEPFELTFVDAGVSNWFLAPVFARLMIGLEFLIGFMLLFNLWLPRYTYKLCYAVLSVFIVYLTIQIIFFGNKGNCGCFGLFIEMTPLQAVMKNILLIGLIAILHRYHKGIDYGKHAWKLFLLLLISSFTLPFLLNPVSFEYSETYLNKPKEGYRLKLEVLYENATLNETQKTLSKGKHVISFMSLTCSHCRIAAKKMRIIHEGNPDISFYFVLHGTDEELVEFFDDTRSQEIPHCQLEGRYFIQLAGVELPSIYLMKNSIVEHTVKYDEISEEAMVNWYKE